MELGGLREDVNPDRATALIALCTANDSWRELVEAHHLSWDEAEAWLSQALGRALLKETGSSYK